MRITYYATVLMKDLNYAQLRLDTNMSRKIFDGYLNRWIRGMKISCRRTWPSSAHYRTNLDKLLVSGQPADLTPAYEIFERFLERLKQHDAYVYELLKEDRFKFNTDDRLLSDRRHSAYPANLDEAQNLWRDELRFQYLQEKLDREISPTNENKIVSLPKTTGTNIATNWPGITSWNHAHRHQLGQRQCPASLPERGDARLRSAFRLFQHVATRRIFPSR